MNLNFLENKPFVVRTGQAWMFDIDYLTDSLNYSRVSSTNLTEVVPIVDKATTLNDDIKSDITQLNADNLDELAKLQALQKQEQAGKEEADHLRLAFPSLNPMLGVGISSISSFISAGSTPSVSAGSTPQMSSPTGSAGRPVSAGRPTGSAGRPVSADRLLGSACRPVSAGRPSGSAYRSSVHAEMQQFRNQKVWVLVPLPDGKRAIGTKWILKNKRDTKGIVCRNKARLVAQGHRQEEGTDYTDVFSLVSRIEAIRIFLAFASFIGFKVYQMDVKSAFLYGKIAEEVYVTQPIGIEDPDHPKKVYKVVKAIYGLHQAPRAWYERLSTFLLKHGYRRGSIDQTLFIKKDSNDIMLSEFEMSSMRSLTFFLGLQVDQRPDGIFIHQEKYVADILKKFDLDNSKLSSTSFEPQKIREKNVPDEPISVHLYRSMIICLMYLTATRLDIMFAVCAAASDYVGAHGDRKSTTGGSEYVAAASCYGQVKQKKDGIFISQDKYVAEILRKFGLTEGKSASTPIDTEKPLLKDSYGEDVDVHTYRKQLGDLLTHTIKYTSPALTQKVFANMRRVGKGFSGVKTPLFEGMIVEQVIEEGGVEGEHVEEDTAGQGDDTTAQEDDTTTQGDDDQEPSIPSPTLPTPPPQKP
uniref:Putative ribonuclease H-like domain-containing protein n=1 Tax=Tanacetum cinerariifolium TaxID=118510 RepID=A0A6L2KAB3_TANCI|nr:putative ribonuclease H-like domain-containing protein [Tanacetum cinerariifolium]